MEEKTSFWKKPEGWVTGAILGAMVLFSLKSIDTIVSLLLNIASNTFSLGLFALGIGALIFVVTSKDIRNGVFFIWKMLMRKMIGIIIETDPIAILRIRIAEAEKERENIFVQLEKAHGSEGELNKKISDNIDKAQTLLSEALSAKKQGYIENAAISASGAAGYEDMNTRLMPLLENLKKIIAVMEKVYKNSGFMVKKMTQDVDIKEQEYKAIKAGNNALQSAMKIFKGDPDKSAIYQQALDFLDADMGKKLGEMKMVMKMTKEFMVNIDIQNGAVNDRGMELLNKLEGGQMTLLKGDSTIPLKTISLDAPSKAPRGYSNLLES